MAQQNWKSYEEVAIYLLDQIASVFGVDHVEGKQTLTGLRSGACYEVEGKAARSGEDGFLIVECRRYTSSRQNQERVGGLAYRILGGCC